jgi:hypothetical protein
VAAPATALADVALRIPAWRRRGYGRAAPLAPFISNTIACLDRDG